LPFWAREGVRSARGRSGERPCARRAAFVVGDRSYSVPVTGRSPPSGIGGLNGLRGARVSSVEFKGFEGAWASANGARRKREKRSMETITNGEAWKNAEVSEGGRKGAEEK
jgi:hypothetical protein